MEVLWILLFAAAVLLMLLRHGMQRTKKSQQMIPISVNYHFTRECNYQCKFCFHTAKNRTVLSEEDALRGLRLLKQAGTRKINFSGGEPFLHPKLLGSMVRYCKEDLQLESVSIVSNGSRIKENWMEKFGKYVDILAISCDSFNTETNELIGRKAGSKDHINSLHEVREWCKKYDVRFKLNTVVCKYNVDEDMNAEIEALNPSRWKVFQVLEIEGENSGPEALRQVRELLITDEQFQSFIERHARNNPIKEDNNTMRNSYLILDEEMRFLNNEDGKKHPTESILKIGVESALQQAGWDKAAFYRRNGEYDWSRPQEAEPLKDIEDLHQTMAM